MRTKTLVSILATTGHSKLKIQRCVFNKPLILPSQPSFRLLIKKFIFSLLFMDKKDKDVRPVKTLLIDFGGHLIFRPKLFPPFPAIIQVSAPFFTAIILPSNLSRNCLLTFCE